MALADFVAELDALVNEAKAAFTSADCRRCARSGAHRVSRRQERPAQGCAERSWPVPPCRQAGGRQAVQRSQDRASRRYWPRHSRALNRPTSGAASEPFDPTVPGKRPVLGHLHPITQTIEELKDIMGRLGFTAADGPEIEDEWHNFEALNIPAAHPARDPLENFISSTAERSSHCGGPLLAAQPDEHGADPRDGERDSRRCGSSRWAASIGPTRPTPRTTRCSTRSKGCWSIAA